MLAFALILGVLGWLLLYSAAKGTSPLDEIRAVFSG